MGARAPIGTGALGTAHDRGRNVAADWRKKLPEEGLARLRGGGVEAPPQRGQDQGGAEDRPERRGAAAASRSNG